VEIERPVDPDIDVHVPGQRDEIRYQHGAVLAVIAVGGVIGAECRYLVSVVLPHEPTGFPLATFLINILGCLLIGMLMVVIIEFGRGHRLARPFLGVGVLGGFTTFSTYATDVVTLAQHQAAALALAYLVATPLAAVAAAWLGAAATRWSAGVLRGRSRPEES
jgi:CrcB protein